MPLTVPARARKHAFQPEAVLSGLDLLAYFRLTVVMKSAMVIAPFRKLTLP